MPELIPPSTRVHESFLSATEEFRREHRGAADDFTVLGAEMRDYGASWSTSEGFGDYVDWLHGQRLEEAPRPEGYVPSTTLWWVDGDVFLGRISIRHRLTPQLLDVGGHIGYDVRPSARRRGNATAMLRAALPIAHSIGIHPALLTCDAGNVASKTVIERNGGVFEDQRGRKLRFWVPTA